MALVRRLIREIWFPALLAGATAGATALDIPNYGPHSLGIMVFLIPLIGFAALGLGIGAAVKRKWFRAGFYVLALCACIICYRILAAIDTYCPECRA